MIVKPLTEHHVEFLSLTGGCRGSSESALVKMSKCWKSHAAAQILIMMSATSCEYGERKGGQFNQMSLVGKSARRFDKNLTPNYAKCYIMK